MKKTALDLRIEKLIINGLEIVPLKSNDNYEILYGCYKLIENNSTKNYEVYEDINGCLLLVSYGVPVMYITKDKVKLFKYSTYSRTTAKHLGMFMNKYLNNNILKNTIREIGISNTYDDVRMYLYDMKIGVFND